MGKSSPKEDCRPFATKNPRLSGKFLCGYIDKKKTNFRICIACNLDIRCKNGVTSPLLRYVDTSVGSSPVMEENRSLLKFLSGKSRKYNLAQRLVYNSNISVNKICTFKEFSELFKLAKLEIPTYSELQESLTKSNLERIESVSNLLAANDPLVLCLDKWTNDHDEKFIGVYVFQKQKKIFLGLENHDSKCPATYMKDRLIEILQKFGIGNFDQFVCVMSDCGSDVVKFCKLIKLPHLPCLAHVLNVLAKKLIGIDADFSVPDDDETGDELDDIFALGV